MMYDINLLPKNERKMSAGMTFLIVFISIAYVAAAVLFGLLLPLKEKENMNSKIKRIKEDIESYDVTEAEYYQLEKTVEEKKREGLALLALRNERLVITALLDNIEVNTPEDIYLENLSIEGGMLNLSGYSPNYEDIAKYIVKLRNMDRVDNTTFTTATLDENDDKEKYQFNLYCNIDQRDFISELQGENPMPQNNEGGTEE